MPVASVRSANVTLASVELRRLASARSANVTLASVQRKPVVHVRIASVKIASAKRIDNSTLIIENYYGKSIRFKDSCRTSA
jgi:hypothetical protein